MSKIGSNTSPPPPSEERTRNDYKDSKKSDDKGQILYGFKAWVKGVFWAVHLLAFNRSHEISLCFSGMWFFPKVKYRFVDFFAMG